MLNENQPFIDVILATCDELDASINNYCIGRACVNCEFQHPTLNCRYKINLLMLLNGYRMGACNEQERKKIDEFLLSKYPKFMKQLENEKI